ncbi:unnamed protein product, partial [Hapterophycus canaliculatus]
MRVTVSRRVYVCVCVQDNLKAVPAVLQLPIGNEADFLGVIDLVSMTAVTWSGEELGANFDVTPLAESTLVDDELKESAAEYHEQLVELAVEQDEDVMMAYLDVSPARPARPCLPLRGC